MSSISSLSTALSALRSSKTALNTTAHNLANVDTPGFVRQQVLMKDSPYLKVGENAVTGFDVGLGVDVQTIRQVRDIFLDQTYREEASRRGFYEYQNLAVEEVETILGEIEGESFAEILDDLWNSLNELSKHPEGLETRGTFIQSAVLFVDRANLIMDQLNSYQKNLNTQVIDMVDEINSIGYQIDELNEIISREEVTGANANDYRDQRNLLLDKLSELVDISYKENANGKVTVKVENVEFVTTSGVNEMGLTQAEPLSIFVQPYWNHLDMPVFNFSLPVSSERENDKGALKGLLLARGTSSANYTDMNDPINYYENIQPSIVMNAQAQFDKLINGVVTMINDTLSPNVGTPPVLDAGNAPYSLDNEQGIELFSRKYVERYDSLTKEYIEEDPSNYSTLYTAGNLEINQEVLENYNKLCLTKTPGNIGDNSVVQEIITKWREPFSSIEPNLSTKLNYNEYYSEYISGIGASGDTINTKLSNQELMVLQIDNQRSTLTGVSSDEELGNVIKYQHAYNAASKVVNVLDQMIEQIVTSTGLVGR